MMDLEIHGYGGSEGLETSEPSAEEVHTEQKSGATKCHRTKQSAKQISQVH